MTDAALSVAQMRDHIAELVKQHNIDCQITPRADFGIEVWANIAHWRIAVPPVDNALIYASALHELGHLLGRYQSRRYGTMCHEVWAWKWAEEHALAWTPTMEWCRRHTLKLYESTDWEPGMSPEQWREAQRKRLARRARRQPALANTAAERAAELCRRFGTKAENAMPPEVLAILRPWRKKKEESEE
jgi:hypothetical protein